MKIHMVQTDRVEIPRAPLPRACAPDDSLFVSFSSDILTLHPRDLNGVTRMVVYDQESDTLFVKEELHGNRY